MARLTEEPFDMPERNDFEDSGEYDQAERKALDEIDDPIVHFPRGDGVARYRVVEWEHVEKCECCGRGGEPLLQHIPFGDAWRASSSTIRGLTTEEARRIAEE